MKLRSPLKKAIGGIVAQYMQRQVQFEAHQVIDELSKQYPVQYIADRALYKTDGAYHAAISIFIRYHIPGVKYVGSVRSLNIHGKISRNMVYQ
jgi:hypothetical protein